MKPLILLKNRPVIYAIFNTISGKTYVGKTKCMYKRCHQYLSDVRGGNKSQRMNEHLYSSMLKYGVDSFEMFPLEFVDDCLNIDERELFWMSKLNTLDQRKGYNLRSDSSTSMIVHVETRRKISERVKREWASGVRDGHSDKMKHSWTTRDKGKQRQTFSKTLTKYQYVITNADGSQDVLLYKELVDRGFKNVVAKFHKHKSTKESFKGVTIERVMCESQT